MRFRVPLTEGDTFVPCDFLSPACGQGTAVKAAAVNVGLMARFEAEWDGGRPLRFVRPAEASPEPPGGPGPDAGGPAPHVRGGSAEEEKDKGAGACGKAKAPVRRREAAHGVPSPPAAGPDPPDSRFPVLSLAQTAGVRRHVAAKPLERRAGEPRPHRALPVPQGPARPGGSNGMRHRQASVQAAFSRRPFEGGDGYPS
jgi:hypothetical protein